MSYLGIDKSIIGHNLYLYCNANPIEYSDSYGTSLLGDLWNAIKDYTKEYLHKKNTKAVKMGMNTSSYGAFFLQMNKDSNGIYHASFDCWQSVFGYNDFYDFVFDIGTSMKASKNEFSCNGKKYIIWAWKGDYINLGAGAELGIYEQDTKIKIRKWKVNKKLAIPMKIQLFYKNKQIISYSSGREWWITGFNPKYLNVKSNKLKTKITLDFSKNREMFNAISKRYTKKRRWTFDSAHCIATLNF